MHPRPTRHSLALVAFTLVCGIAVRFLHLGLPPFVMKYAGSIFWAAMIYWIVSSALGRSCVAVPALISGVLATAVEVFKLYRSPPMDAFRTTLPGVLLLGRYFSFWDIVAYWVGITAAAALDRTLRAQG